MKNLLLFSTLLLTTASAFAQLSVKPTSGGADSYVYVSDEILFVTNEVALTKNTTASTATEASIYLRNNGQLIQGNNSLNSGTGQLSAQQNSPVTNAFAYYYWCSPVGNTINGATVTPPGNRNFMVRHLYEPDPSTSVIAANQAGTTRDLNGRKNPMVISTRWMYTFMTPGTEALGNYKSMDIQAATPGFGFTMKGLGTDNPGSDQVYDFRGRPNNGSFAIPVAEPVVTLPNPDPIPQMTLAGNPYPSALDLNQLFYDAGNEELAALWYYDEDRSVASHYYSQKPFGYGVWTPGGQDTDGNLRDNFPTGDYVHAPFNIYNPSGNTGTGPGTFGTNVNGKRYAPIGQGIMFVGGTFPALSDGFVNVRNSQRIFVKEGLTNGSVFQRPDGDDTANETNANVDPTLSTSTGAIPVDNRTPSLRLWSVFDDAVTREMLIAFYDQGTDGYDRGLDGLSAQDLKTDAYFPIGPDNNRMPYVINGTNYNVDKQIPIAFKVQNATQIRLQVAEEVKKPYQHAYLFDSQENTYKELTNATISGATLSLPAGTYDNRFFIVFRNQNLKRDIPATELEAKATVLANVNVFQNNPTQQMEVSNPEGYTINTAAVYDMNGKLVIQEKNLGSNNKYSFYTGNLSDGVYLVKLTTAEDITIDYKVIVHNK